MGDFLELLVFRLGLQAHALHLHAVQRAVRAAAVTPLPGAPPPVIGILDVAGRVLPVLSIRRRLGLEPGAIEPHMHFLIARMANRDVVLPVEEITGVVRVERGAQADDVVANGFGLVEGVVRLDDGLVLIDDLEKFFSPDEWRQVERALEGART